MQSIQWVALCAFVLLLYLVIRLTAKAGSWITGSRFARIGNWRRSIGASMRAGGCPTRPR